MLTIRWRMLWCLCLGRGKGKQRLSKYGVCQVLISSAAKVCLSELLSVLPQSPPLASAHKTSSSSSKYNGGNYNMIIHWDKIHYSYLCAKTISRNWTKLSARWLRKRSWHWPGGVKIVINVQNVQIYKMFKMFISVKIANLRLTAAWNAVLWKHPWPPKWSCSKNLMADSAHDKDSQSAHFSRYQELYAEFLGNEDESSVACNLFGSLSTLSF